MKKILSLLATLGIANVGISTIIGCKSSNPSSDVEQDDLELQVSKDIKILNDISLQVSQGIQKFLTEKNILLSTNYTGSDIFKEVSKDSPNYDVIKEEYLTGLKKLSIELQTFIDMYSVKINNKII